MTLDAVLAVGQLLVAAGLGGGVTFLLTLRQRRALLTAQAGKVTAEASDVAATGTARILDAAGRIVEQQADLVPQLLQRIASLEATEKTRAGEVDKVRERADRAEQQLAVVLAELEAMSRHVDESQRWMGNALRVVLELGGDIPPPPPPPEHTRPAVLDLTSTGGQQS